MCNEEIKIYNLDGEEKQRAYIRKHTNALDGISDDIIKQIQTDYYNNVYVVLNDNNLYKNGEFYSSNIDGIWMLDGLDLYMITKDNMVISLREFDEDMDEYLNNNNCKYKKIIYNVLTFVALTNEGRVIATTCDPSGFGIIPEHFIDIDDILFIEDIPHIIKDGKTMQLFIGKPWIRW